MTIEGAPESLLIVVGKEQCEPQSGTRRTEVERYLPSLENGVWGLVALPNPPVVAGSCPVRRPERPGTGIHNEVIY